MGFKKSFSNILSVIILILAAITVLFELVLDLILLIPAVVMIGLITGQPPKWMFLRATNKLIGWAKEIRKDL